MDNKSKIIYGIIGFVIILIIFFVVKGNLSGNATIELKGNTEIIIYENDPWVDPGYEIVGGNSGYYVNIDGNVNSSTMGVYYLNYLLYSKSGKLIHQVARKVIVLEDQESNIDMMLNGEEEEYYFVNDYQDKGITAYRNNFDITNLVQIIDETMPSMVGDYQVKYQVSDNNSIKEIVRTVHIIDYQIEDSSDELKQNIDFIINCDDYAYTILPDDTKEYSKNVLYHYNAEGVYTFDIYLKSGSHKEYKVTIASIDHKGPTGTCSLSFDKSMTKVTINAKDESGIKKYSYNGMDFYSSPKTISGIIGNVTVRVYDTRNNYTDIKCKASYGTAFRTLSLDNGGIVSGKSGYIVCGTNMTQANQELENLMKAYGNKTRDAVAAAGLYLTTFKYNIPYFWGGKYLKKGLNPEWGCRKSHSSDHKCTKPLASDYSYCEWGLDCTGLTTWSFIQAGFDSSIIRTYNQEGDKWGNFDASKHRYAFNSSNRSMADQIKPGDIVYVTRKHVGLVIGVDQNTVQVTNMVGPIRISVINKSNGSSTNGQNSFDGFVLMDEFYKMYGNS